MYLEIILRLPLTPPAKTGTEYLQGFVDATLTPINQAIEDGVLYVDAMLDAGWELDIPQVVPSV